MLLSVLFLLSLMSLQCIVVDSYGTLYWSVLVILSLCFVKLVVNLWIVHNNAYWRNIKDLSRDALQNTEMPLDDIHNPKSLPTNHEDNYRHTSDWSQTKILRTNHYIQLDMSANSKKPGTTLADSPLINTSKYFHSTIIPSAHTIMS